MSKQQKVSLEPELTKAVQIGRSVISFTIKEETPDEEQDLSPRYLQKN